MVEFKIYGKEETSKEEVVYLTLKEGYGKINLVACDEDGDEISSGYILAITDDGELIRHSAINGDYFDTDKHGKIRVKD